MPYIYNALAGGVNWIDTANTQAPQNSAGQRELDFSQQQHNYPNYSSPYQFVDIGIPQVQIRGSLRSAMEELRDIHLAYNPYIGRAQGSEGLRSALGITKVKKIKRNLPDWF